MPPTKSTAGKLADTKASNPGRKGTVINGMRGRMGCNNPKVTGMKVTGMKGRMGGAPNRAHMQQSIPFRAVKAAGKRKSKKKLTTDMILSGNKQQDEALLKLRIPLKICTVLPSVKKFTAKAKGTKGKKKATNMVFEEEDRADVPSGDHHPLFSQKKRKTDFQRYEITYLMEHRFQGMIWDLAFTQDGDIVVTGSEGAILCDSELKEKAKFENMFLPGAIAFLADGRILIVDRSSNTVNFYRRNATFIRSFIAGNCPMGMVVTSQDEIVVSDTGDKCVRKFDINGKLLMKIATEGERYQLRWPLYLGLYSNDDIVVSDVHQQKVYKFDKDGIFDGLLSLKTHSGSSVLRPHGVCMTKKDELMVIDTSIESLELFLPAGMYMQTLLIPDSGSSLEPKLCKVNHDNTLLGVGGMTGIIRLYQLTSIIKEECKKTELSSSTSLASASTSSSSSSSAPTKVKVEIKEELVSH